MAVNYCGCQLAQRFGWVASAYHLMESAIQHTGACKYNLKYDRRLNGCFDVSVGTWNLGSLSGKGVNVCV